MTDARLTLRQAAAVLNVSESAIRKRVERRTLRSDKGADGKRYVYLDTVADNMADEGEDASATPEHGALISELRAHNDTLREQLKAERQAHAEARRIIAGLVERMPALEAPQDSPEGGPVSPEPGEDDADRSELFRGPQRVDEATDTGEGVDSDWKPFNPRRQARIAFLATVIVSFTSLLGTIIAAAGDSLSGIITSIGTAFSTVISSGLSAITGDQVVQIVGPIITVVGTIAATYLGIRWRRGRDQ